MKTSAFSLIMLFMLLAGAPAFPQAAVPEGGEENTTGLSEEGMIVQEIKERYAKAEYERCQTVLRNALARDEEGTLHFPNHYLAELRIYQALLTYAFRETGYEKEVERFLLQAIETNINYDFPDYTIIPTYILEKFISIKREYLNQFSKTSRHHSLGVYIMASYLTTYVQANEYLNLGLHYGFNLDEYFTLILDVEFPLSINLLNLMQFRVGGIWFPSSKVETVSLGLGLLYSLKIEDWKAFINVFSFEGYGEFIFRAGLGIGACVELVRFDILMGTGSFPTVGYVPFFSNKYVRFTFANLRIYAFWNF